MQNYKSNNMDKRGYWIILVICVILLCVCAWSYFKYTYHERDESYANVNGVYIKCVAVDNGSECSLPDGKIIKVVRTYNSTIK